MQGDVIAIVDKDAKTVAEYSYDAWCAVTSAVTDTELTNDVDIATITPFRYRSYYLDTETGFYFLKTRYYDPEIGRFITIDDISYLNPKRINGLNLYAYCKNNPVIGYDPNGTFALTTFLICLAIGAVIGGVLGGYTAFSLTGRQGSN